MPCAPATAAPRSPSSPSPAASTRKPRSSSPIEITDVARDLDAPEVLVGGNVLVGEQFGTASENDLLRGEAIALPIAFLAMIFLLGGLRAAGMPMLVALAGVVTSLAVLVARDRAR